jgi:hypothetical protein
MTECESGFSPLAIVITPLTSHHPPKWILAKFLGEQHFLIQSFLISKHHQWLGVLQAKQLTLSSLPSVKSDSKYDLLCSTALLLHMLCGVQELFSVF